MRRFIRLTFLLASVVLVAALTAACGATSTPVAIPSSDTTYQADYSAAMIFHQRCAGCHTLSYAKAYGSGNNPRTYLTISGPNFNQRCERPVARVLYAIENGGFSGAYMPADIVVGQQARQVAMFVAKFAGRQAPIQPDTTPCEKQPIGSLPSTMTGGVDLGTSTSSTPNAGVTSTNTTITNPPPTTTTATTSANPEVPTSTGSKAITTAPAAKSTAKKKK